MIINGSDIGGELYVWKFSRGKSEQWFDDCSNSEWEVDGDIVKMKLFDALHVDFVAIGQGH